MVVRRAIYVKNTTNAMPLVRAKKLAAQMAAEDLARSNHPRFSPTQALRDPSIDYLGRDAQAKRSEIYRRSWRWAARNHIRSSHRLSAILLLDPVKRTHAHYRLGMLYYEDGEYELAAENLDKVLALDESGHPRYTTRAIFWRARARCDVELYMSTHGNGEERLSLALASYRKCFDHTTITVIDVDTMPTLFLELAALYERFGAFAGALYFLKIVLEFFRNNPAFEDAAFRCALVLKYASSVAADRPERIRLLNSCLELLEMLRVNDDIGEEIEHENGTWEGCRRKYRNDECATLLYARACQARTEMEAGHDDDAREEWAERTRAAYEELFSLRRTNGREDAATCSSTPSDFRSWLCKRSTWHAIAVELTDLGEPTLVADACEVGLTIPRKSAPDDRFVEHPDDDVGMLLRAQFAYEHLLDKAKARRCAERAFAANEWDMRARRAVAQLDPHMKEQFDMEDVATTVVRRAWRGRVWRSPFQQRLKQRIIERAEAAILRDRFGAKAARRDLAYFAAAKWRPLFLYEVRCSVRVQRFLRQQMRYKREFALALSRHLRALGSALSRCKRSPWHMQARESLIALAFHDLTPNNHAAKSQASLILRQQNAVPLVERFLRGAVARLTYLRHRTTVIKRVEVQERRLSGQTAEREQQPQQVEDECESVNKDGLFNESSVAFVAAQAIQSRIRGCLGRTSASTRKHVRDEYAARAVTRCVRRVIIQRKEARFLISSRHFVANSLQRQGRRWLGIRLEAACILERQARGSKARSRVAKKRAEYQAARIVTSAWRCFVAKERGQILLRRLRACAASRNVCVGPTLESIKRIIDLAVEDEMRANRDPVAERLAAATKKRRPRKNIVSKPLWPKLGMPGTSAFQACAKRMAWVASSKVDESSKESQPLSGVEVPLFTLFLSHWNCRLQTLALIDATDALGRDNPSALQLAAALSGCKSLAELVLVRCALGPRTIATLFAGMTACGFSLRNMLLDQDFFSVFDIEATWPEVSSPFPPAASQKNVWLPAHEDELSRTAVDGGKTQRRLGDFVGRCAGGMLGDAIFQQVGSLRSLGLCRCKIGDVGACAIGRALTCVSTLEVLRLDENDVGDDGAAAMATALEKSHRLRELSLPNNRITSNGAAFMLRALARRVSPFHVLVLRDNFIDDCFLDDFLSHQASLSRHPAAACLNMDGNAWRSQPLARFNKLLAHISHGLEQDNRRPRADDELGASNIRLPPRVLPIKSGSSRASSSSSKASASRRPHSGAIFSELRLPVLASRARVR